MTQRIVDTEIDRKLLISFIGNHDLPMTVNITKGGQRSIKQNRLFWLWLNEIAEQLTEDDVEGWRAYCKLHFGVPVLRAADEKFREMYDRIIRPLDYPDKLDCMRVPIDLPVTSQMNTRQKRRFLDAVYHHFTVDRGVVLTLPLDKSLTSYEEMQA